MLAQLFLNACVTGTRMAAPLQALRLGHGEAAVGLLIALFALAQVFLALPAGRYLRMPRSSRFSAIPRAS